jgi:hypothetical protein
MAMLSEQAVDNHLSETVQQCALPVARRQVQIYQEIISQEDHMSIEKIQQKMERLKLNHTMSLICDLFEEAVKEKNNPRDFFYKYKIIIAFNVPGFTGGNPKD